MRTPDASRFGLTTAWVWCGLLVWAAYFLAVYVFAALACERGFAGHRIAGYAIVPFAAACGLLVTLAINVTVAVVARRRLTRERPGVSTFVEFLALALALLGVLALVWTALPPLLLRTGCA